MISAVSDQNRSAEDEQPHSPGEDRERPAGTGSEGLRYLFVLSRPRFWLYLAGPVAVGVTYGIDAVSGLFTPVTIALAAYFLVPANVFLYGVNDVFDADIDVLNPKKEGREARWRGSRFVIAAVVASGLLGLATLAITPHVAWPYLLGFLVLAVGYSAPPARFKTTPFLDS
ncbi:lycopene elongase, partial [Halorubrum sp. E3]